MASNTRIPPAVNESFIRFASNVCDQAKMDYDEWLPNSQELVYHLQNRWRELVDQELSTDAAEAEALRLFGGPSVVAKSLRKPWLMRLFQYKRFRPERFYFFILGYFLYTWVVISDTHWKDLIQGHTITPFQILLPFGLDFWINGIGSMLIGLAAAGCVVLAQWQPIFKRRWLNQLLLIRYSLLLVTGYALFALIIRSPIGAYKTLTAFMVDYSLFTSISIPFCIMHVIGIVIGLFGATCLIFEISDRNWNNLRVHTTLAGILIAVYVSFAPPPPKLPPPPGPKLPAILSTILDYNITGTTKIGKDVRGWLNKKEWFKIHQNQELIEQKPNPKNAFQITQSFHSDPQETYDFEYFYVGGDWKFHDIHLHSLHGVNFDLDLSFIIGNHAKAQGLIMLTNGVLTDTQKSFVSLFFNSVPFTQATK